MTRALLATALLLLCAGAGAAPAAAADHAIAVKDFEFAPATITVAVGDSITWSYASGSSAHNVDFTDGPVFTQPAVPEPAGWTAQRTFDAAGTFHYQCDLHTYMTGTVVVTAPSSAPAADTTPPAASHIRVSHGALRFGLSENASLRATLRRGGKPVRQLGVALKAGVVAYRLPRHLRAGRYTIRFVLTDAAGNHSRTYGASFNVT